MKSNKKPFSSSSRYANTTDPKATPPSASSTRDFPPKLTEEERRLLMEHLGCLKCCKAGHRAHQCTTTISGKGYKTLTSHDAQRAKAAKAAKPAPSSQMNTVASISEVPGNKTDDFMAAIFPSLPSGLIGDGSFSDGSDSSLASVSKPPPLKSKHFIWNCSLTGPAVTFPVTTPSLIDNGCHMVLIRPDTVEKLGLPIFALKEPKIVNVTISFSASHGKTNLLYIMLNLVPFLRIQFSSLVLCMQ
jgi:hypothetical protein